MARFYLNGIETAAEEIMEAVGQNRLRTMIMDAEEGYRQDPLEQQSFMVASGILTIEI